MKENNPVINPVVVLRKEFDDWAVLFNPDTAEAVGINPVGVAIWEMLSRHEDRESVHTGIMQSFTGVPETMAAEIDSFIRELAEHGFVGYETESRD